jgi:polyisoprenyl-phosphate glycosyltransferase
MMKAKVTAIVPAHNEEKTVGEVIRVLKSSDLIKEVIVVSDGSRDKTVKVARMAGARVIALPKQLGKGKALLAALKQTRSEIIAFFDADLIGFTKDHVELLALPVVNGARAMNVGIRDRGAVGRFISHHGTLISGERVMLKSVADGVPESFMDGFMVENSLNYYCRTRKLIYGWVDLPGLSIVRKYNKVKFSKAVVQYLKMSYEILKGMIIVRLAYLIKRF